MIIFITLGCNSIDICVNKKTTLALGAVNKAEQSKSQQLVAGNEVLIFC
jgi:hypothetical protein